MGKDGSDRQTDHKRQYNTAHALCMLDNWSYGHTPRICNSYSMATMVTRTRLSIRLYVHRLALLTYTTHSYTVLYLLVCALWCTFSTLYFRSPILSWFCARMYSFLLHSALICQHFLFPSLQIAETCSCWYPLHSVLFRWTIYRFSASWATASFKTISEFLCTWQILSLC